MLIRAKGGHSGIKEYLEEGVKNGRDYTRDELDYRVMLSGDLQLTNNIIQQMETDGQRYLHITLSFKEDAVSQQQLHTITEEFRQFVFHAYDDDEYCFYAEAHLPKIKTLPDKETGELIERKPHIHVVIPETNLRTHQRLEPLGKVDLNKIYIDAFQEVMNEKYGFASPKVHVRGEFTDKSTVKYGEVFTGANKTIKQQILSDIINHDIRTPQELKAHLSEQGFIVRERHAGKPNSYLNAKLPHGNKGINLKDNVFQATFLALPKQEKEQRLSQHAKNPYLESGQPYKAPEFAHEALSHWYAQRAAEVRFVTRRNREKYRTLTPEQQRAFLKEKQELARGYPTPSSESRHYQRDINENLRTAGEYLSHAERNCYRIKSGIRNIAHRRAIRTVRAALQRCEYYQATPQPYCPERQRSDNIVNHLNEALRQEKSPPLDNVSADALLKHLSYSHGVQSSKYAIQRNETGKEFIRCGEQLREVHDFLTKEMHFSQREARDVIYNLQAHQQHERKQFTHEWQPEHQQQRKAVWNAQRQYERNLRAELNRQYRIEKNAIYGDTSLTKAERKAALSIAKMNKVLADMAHQAYRKYAHQQLREAYPLTQQAQYQQFTQRHQKTEKYIMEKTLQGKLIEHGHAPYEFKNENKQSYFVTIKRENDTLQTVWGEGLADAINKCQPQKGDNITLTRQNSDQAHKFTHVQWEIKKEQTLKQEVTQQEHTHLTNEQLDKKLQATRLLVHYPKLKTLGVTLHHIKQTDAGDKINYNNKALSVSQLMRETHGFTDKQVNEELNRVYESQERDKQRVIKYKNEYITKYRPEVSRDNKKTSPENHKEATHETLTICSKEKTKSRTPLPPKQFDEVTHKTDRDGNVSYYLNNKKIVVDRGDHVCTFGNTDKAIEIGLRLSIEKFGKTLDVKGTPEYKEKLTEIAAKNKLDIEFTDPQMNQMLQQKQAQHHKGMSIIQKAQTAHMNNITPTKEQHQEQTNAQQKSNVERLR